MRSPPTHAWSCSATPTSCLPWKPATSSAPCAPPPATDLPCRRRSKPSADRPAALQAILQTIPATLQIVIPATAGTQRLPHAPPCSPRSEEPTSELQSLIRLSYAVFSWKKKQH